MVGNGLLENDVWVEEPTTAKKNIKDFFEARFMEGENIQVRLDNIPFNCISEEGNVNISRAFSEEKIKDAIWDCEGLKSLEPDGYNFEFIKFTWDIVKADFVRAIQNFENSEVWPMGLNVSFIALIPKVNNPSNLNEFRPISLIGCIYKIVSKLP